MPDNVPGPLGKPGLSLPWWVALAVAIASPVLLVYVVDPVTQPEAFATSIAVYVVPTAWGALLALRLRKRLAQEAGILDWAEGQAVKLQGTPGSWLVDKRTYERFLPVDSYAAGATDYASARMVQGLCQEAIGHRFPPAVAVTQVYAAQIMAGARQLRTPQSTALRLGIMLTFVGLLVSISDVATIFATQLGDQVPADSITGLMLGLQVAFGTSVAGLMSAIILQFFAELLVQAQRQLVSRLEDVAGSVLNALVRAQTGQAFSTSLDQLRDGLIDHSTKLNDHVTSVNRALTAVEEHFREHVREIAEGARDVAADSATLGSVIQAHREQVQALQGLVAEVGRLDGRLGEALTRFGDRVDEVEGALSQSARDAFDKALSTLAATVDGRFAHLDSASQTLARSAGDLQSAGDRLAVATDRLAGATASAPAPDTADLAEAVRCLTAAVADLRRAHRRRTVAATAVLVLLSLLGGVGWAVATGWLPLETLYPVSAPDPTGS